jgi:hypothetical protein
MQLVTNCARACEAVHAVAAAANEYTAAAVMRRPAEAKRNASSVQPDAASRCGND